MTRVLGSMKQQLNNYWDGLNKSNKRNLLIIVGLIILAIIFASVIMGKKDYVVLYSDLSEKEAAEVYTKLKEAGAQPKMSGTSTVLVPKEKEAELRMQMTMEGYPKSGFNYDLYLEGGGFGQTDDEMQKRWVIQLQERLGQSIKFLEGVEEAVVTIGMPKSDSFVLKDDETPVSASVIILPKEGYEITHEQAKSIEQLVAKSVPKLDKQNISIIDHRMNILNTEDESESKTLANQFTMQQQLEDRIKKEIISLLEPVFGYGKVNSAVNVRLNFDKKVTESVTFEPVLDDSGIIVSQELLKERMTNNLVGGIPGEATNTTQYPELDGEEGSTSQRDHKKINYEVNEIKEMIEEEQGKVDELSIAVVIDGDDIDQQTIEGVRELVSTSMGTDPERVAVQSWEFDTDMQQDLIDAIQDGRRSPSWLNRGTLIVIIGGIVLLILLMVLARGRSQEYEELPMDEEIEEPVPVEEFDLTELEAGEENKVKKQLDKFAKDQPDAVAQLLRNWLSEE